MNSSERPVALVTGGARRVGLAIVRMLVDRGYRIAIHANSSIDEAEQLAAELRSAGADALAVAAQLRDEHAIVDMINTVHSHFGQLDALVNSAAIWKSKPLEQVTAEDVREHFEINALGTFLCCQHAGLLMSRQPSGGAIVNLGDWAVIRPYLDYAAYFPSKGSIPTLTRNFAVELARRNPKVRVNAVLPGPVMLPAEMPDEERQAVIRGTLVQREGRPENVAHAVLFLLENDFITGVCLPVDGGRSIFGGFDL